MQSSSIVEHLTSAVETEDPRGLYSRHDCENGKRCKKHYCWKFVAVATGKLFDVDSFFTNDFYRGCLIRKAEYGRSEIHIAARHGQNEMIGKLIERGVPVDLQDDFGMTALMLSLYDRQFHTAEFLLDAGANLNSQDYQGATALHIVAEHNLVEAAQLLFDYGKRERFLSVNAFDSHFQTPFDRAFLVNNHRMAQMLVENGAVAGVHSRAKLLEPFLHDDALAFVWDQSPLRRLISKIGRLAETEQERRQKEFLIEVLLSLLTTRSVFRETLVDEASLLIGEARMVDPESFLASRLKTWFFGLLDEFRAKDAKDRELLDNCEAEEVPNWNLDNLREATVLSAL